MTSFKQQQELKLSQRLSPQQILTIKLLELPAVELVDRVKRELEENPALEEGADVASWDESKEETTVEGGISNEDNSADIGAGTLSDALDEDALPTFTPSISKSPAAALKEIPFSVGAEFIDLLMDQLAVADVSKEISQIATFLIGSLDGDGYLRRDLRAVKDDMLFQLGLDVEDDQVTEALQLIQGFDPPGVGAVDLQDCLLLQLKRKDSNRITENAILVVRDYFKWFSLKHFDKIGKALNLGEDELKSVVDLIVGLNPKPGNGWGDGIMMALQQVVPDFTVELNGEDLVVTLNNSEIPPLRVSSKYKDMMEDFVANTANQTKEKRDALVFIRQKLDAANWFIEAVQQRQQTLMRVMEVIVDLQKDFFLSGNEAMLHPMILKDVAERCGYDISTVSRVSNSKYVQTCWGVFLLKYFFSEAMSTIEGEEVSNREIKALIREQIEKEDKQHPITDDEMATYLKGRGYKIARRTVAKYREGLGLPVARLRKEI